jgi:protein-L-isoaspartate(D-aspartate) O-methyltransferase
VFSAILSPIRYDIWSLDHPAGGTSLVSSETVGELDDIRRRYAEEILAAADIRSDALAAAFAKVPREHFLGQGPWHILTPGSHDADYRITTDSDPAQLYRDRLVAIDPVRRLNNGQPSYLAFCLDALELESGNRVLHVGCGVGYYTAIAAKIVGPTGHVIGIEIDADLASRARKNLDYLNHVDVVHTDGGEYDPGPCDAIFVNAGATHPRALWLDRLRPDGRLILFLTVAFDDSGAGKGGTLKVKRGQQGYAARFLSSVAVFHCIGSRQEEADRRLRESIMRGGWQSVRSLRREPHEPEKTCWLHGDDFCLSAALP